MVEKLCSIEYSPVLGDVAGYGEFDLLLLLAEKKVRLLIIFCINSFASSSFDS